jgi:hypothetical protein
MEIRKNKVILISLSSVILILLIVFFLSPYSTALLKSKSYFIKHPYDHRVLYEPGAEEYAGKIAAFLPAAIERVEQVHGLPFIEPFKVYVCGTQKSFNEFTANTSGYPIRGAALPGNVFIAPAAFSFKGKDTHRESLVHELSHLHFRQRPGFFKERKIPVWFSEGFADYVAGSGGEGINDTMAVEFILNGRHFIPEEEGKIFGSFGHALNGLSGPMFHKQVKMFVTWLAESDSLKFRSFILALQKGESFSKTFSIIMGSGIKEKWTQFVSGLKQEYSNKIKGLGK